MGRCCSLAGLILVAFAAAHAQARTFILPPSPGLNLQSAPGANFVHENLASGGNTVGAPAWLGPSGADASSAVPIAVAQKGEPICGITHLVRCVEDVGEDEKGIFTSPLRVQPKDTYWLAPLAAATGLAFAYDADAAQAVGINASRANIANKVADFGSFYATGAEGAGIYFIGLAQKDPKLAETGRLGAEAVIDSGTVTLVTKLVSNRQRPDRGNGQGDFWAEGTSRWGADSSFPSDHATASMALARVIAGEYPHWYVMLPAYGFAESIGISRLIANQHFPSDVLVGQAIGFLTGSYVLNHRALHRPGRQGLAARLIDSINPITDPQTHTLGASMEVPLGRIPLGQ